jgi:hypothetical protein
MSSIKRLTSLALERRGKLGQFAWAVALTASLLMNIVDRGPVAAAEEDPCEPSPPPTTPPPDSADTYTTTFPNTENPLSEGGIWTQGGTHGRAWQNMLSQGGSPGFAYGSGPSPDEYNDNLALVQHRFSPTRHFAEIVVRQDASYAPPSTHEIEVHVAGTMTSNHYQGYELLWNLGDNLQPVRLDGPVGDFRTDVLTVLWGDLWNLTVAHNDRIRVEFDSSSGKPVITVYKNGVKRVVLTDTTGGNILSGSPGIGAFARPGTGLDLKRFAIKEFKAGNL